MRKSVNHLFIAISLLFLSRTVCADPLTANHYLWTNANYPGHYVLYDFPTKTYLETVDCRVLWRFNVVSNQLNTLTLFEPSRGMTMQLNYEGMYLKTQGATAFTFYQSGAFDKRWQFSHNNPGGASTGAITLQHGCDAVEYLSGATSPTWRFKQVNRTKDFVDLYDASRDMLVRLTSDSMFLRTGSNPLAFFKKGHW